LQLVAFNDCDQLLNGLRAAAKESVGPYGFGGGIGGTVADPMMEKGAAADAAGAPRRGPRFPSPPRRTIQGPTHTKPASTNRIW
jgi:hypothetical protein